MNYSNRLCQRLNLCLTESAAPPTTRRLCQQVRSGSPFTSPLQRTRSADAGLAQAWNQKLIRSGIFFFSPSPSPFETWAAAAAADSVEATPTASDHRGLRGSGSFCPSSTFIIKCSRSVKSCEDGAHTDWSRSVSECERRPLNYLTISDGHFSLSMWPRRVRSTVAACCPCAPVSWLLRHKYCTIFRRPSIM